MLIEIALGIGQIFMRNGSEHTVQRYQVSAIALCLSETNCGTRTVFIGGMFFMRRSLHKTSARLFNHCTIGWPRLANLSQ